MATSVKIVNITYIHNKYWDIFGYIHNARMAKQWWTTNNCFRSVRPSQKLVRVTLMFFFLLLCPISPRWYHPPSSQCFSTGMFY